MSASVLPPASAADGAAAVAPSRRAPPCTPPLTSTLLQWGGGAGVPPLAPACTAAAGQPVHRPVWPVRRWFWLGREGRDGRPGAAAAAPEVPPHCIPEHQWVQLCAGSQDSRPPGSCAVPTAAQVGAGWPQGMGGRKLPLVNGQMPPVRVIVNLLPPCRCKPSRACFSPVSMVDPHPAPLPRPGLQPGAGRHQPAALHLLPPAVPPPGSARHVLVGSGRRG